MATQENFYPDKAGLCALVASLAGLQNGITAAFSNEPGTFDAFAGLGPLGAPLTGPAASNPSPAVSIWLNIPTFTDVGVDDTINALNETTNLLEVLEAGLRHFTLTIRIESDNVDTQAVAERIRAGFQRRSTIAPLHELRCALRDVLEARPLEIKWNNRTIKATNLDVLLTYGFAATDPNGGESAGDWIEDISYKDPSFTESE